MEKSGFEHLTLTLRVNTDSLSDCGACNLIKDVVLMEIAFKAEGGFVIAPEK